MKTRRMMQYLLPVLCLLLLAGTTGCASGGGSRGSLSNSGTNDSGKDGSGRGSGRTRTKNDTQKTETSASTSSQQDEDEYEYYDPYYEEEPDGLTVFLAGLITSLFSGGDDDEEEVRESDPTFQYRDSSTVEQDTHYREFGLSEEDDGDGEDGDDGGGLDITRGNLNFSYSRSQLSGDAIQSFTTYSLMYSGYTGARYRGHLGLYYGQGKKGSQAWVQDEIRWISEAGIDFGSRGYLTPEHSLLGFYMLVGIRAGALYWSYYDALPVLGDDGNPESVSHDGVMIFTPYLGLGTSLLQTKSVHVGLNFTVGGRMTLGKTFKEYDNDVFKNVGEYKLNIEASIFF